MENYRIFLANHKNHGIANEIEAKQIYAEYWVAKDLEELETLIYGYGLRIVIVIV